MRKSRRILALLVLIGALAAAQPAAATTFCVPAFHSACPSGGGNVAQPSLQTALQTSGDDTIPDRIVIAAGTVTAANTFDLDSGDNDDLEIVGAGPAATAITTSDTGNPFVMNLNGARDITMRNLTIRIPASFDDNLGGAVQADQALFENVDIESRNPRSDGLAAVGGGTFRDGRLYGSAGGSIDDGFKTNGAETGELLIERTSIEGPSWGVNVQDPEVVTRVRRTRIVDPLAYGVRISQGGFAVVENSIIESDTGIPVVAEADDPGTVIATVRHTTIVGSPTDPNDPAVQAKVQNQVGNGSVNLVVSDTIIAGYENPLWCEAPTAANVGNASLTARYSYFFHSATVLGDCTLSNPNTIDAFDPDIGPPQFVGATDYHLPPGSPAIDSGDPLTVTLPTSDYDGAPRPVDGDGDGDSQRDMGAFEYQPPGPDPTPVTPKPPPGGGGGGGGAGGDVLAFGTDTLITLRLARKRIPARGPVAVVISNRNGFEVNGKLSGQTTRRVAVSARRRKRRIRLKAKSFSVAAHAKKTVRLRLPRTLRRVLRRKRKLSLRLTARVLDPAGNRRTVRRKVSPRLKKRRTRR